MTLLRPTLALLALLALTPATALAAESYDNCTGFVDSLPTTISTQGVWCLRQNVSTAITSGSAISITTNNVTLDCNDFKIGGLAAGDSSAAHGINAFNVQNVTVRNCGVRGFYRGIAISAGAGHLVEDNRLDNNLRTAIFVDNAVNSLVRNNRVYDTGGHPASTASWGISASADVIDNQVNGVFVVAVDGTPRGIATEGADFEVTRNQVRGVIPNANGLAIGISGGNSGVRLIGNHVSAATTATTGTGMSGGGADTYCMGNTAAKFNTAYTGCENSSGNL